MKSEIALEFVRQFTLRHYNPYESIEKEGEVAQMGYVVLEGSVSLWRSEPCSSQQEAEAAMEQLSKRKTKKGHAQDYNLAPPRVLVVPPSCELSAWAVIRPQLEEFIQNFSTCNTAMPGGLAQLSTTTNSMAHLMEHALSRVKAWMTQCTSTYITSDLDDICAHPDALLELQVLKTTAKDLLDIADTTRCELLLRKFYLQLATCRFEHDPILMETPYGTEQAEEYLKVLDENNQSYILCDVPGMLISKVSRGFEELTGYTAAEAIGRNPRCLSSPIIIVIGFDVHLGLCPIASTAS